RNVDGAISTFGLLRRRFTLPVLCGVRTKARPPSTAMLTAVPTGVPSRRYVVSRTALWRTNGPSNFSREVIVGGSFGSQTLELDADPHSLPIHQRASKVVADTQYDGAGGGQKHRGERRLRSVEVEAANEQ